MNLTRRLPNPRTFRFFTLLVATLIAPIAAFASVGVNKTFNPTNVSAGQVSTLTVILLNNNTLPATAAAFTDNLPGTVVVATPANTTTGCGGTVTAASGASSFSFAGGTIPAASGGVAGQCSITVDVVSPTAGVFINNIPANSLSSSQGTNSQNANATLTVAALRNITGTKAFAPGNLHGGGNPSTVTITLTNPNGVALTTAAFNDALPAGLAIATTPNASTTCGAGTVTATAGAATASLAAGTIPAAGSCTVKFDVVASAPNAVANGNVTNTIGAGAVTTAQGVVNTAFSGAVRLQTAASITKAFAPTPITTGGTSTLTITINNFNASTLSPITFTDTLPTTASGSIVVAPTPNLSTTCANVPPGTLTSGANTITITNASLAGVAVNAGISNTSCTIKVDVVGTSSSLNPNTLTNTIAAGNFGGTNYAATSGALVINAATSVSGSKAFAPTPVLQGGTSTLTVTLNNSSASIATLTSAFTDNVGSMGAGFTIAAAPPATTTCGGALTAAVGATSFSLAVGGTIPAAGNCTITVPIQVAANATTGNHTNTIAQGTLQTNQGRTQAAITAVLAVNPVLSVAKAVAPATVAAGADTRMTITLTRAAGATSLSGLAFTDPLPAGHVVSATPNLVNNCGGAVTATSGTNTVSLAGGALAGGAAATSCTILVNITTPAGAGASTNTIAVGAVSSSEGFVNPAAASATITRVVTSVTLNKSFSPATVLVGGTSTLTINILNSNANAIALTLAALTDALPTGMAVAAIPAATNTCGGTFTPVAGATSIALSNAAIAANTSCKLTVNVVANASGNLTNTLGAGAFTSAQGVTNPQAASATLAATGVADLAITKTDGVASVTPGTTTTYTIVARNNGPNAVAGAGVVDNPPAGVAFTGWTCVASAGSACNASGSGPINELVTLLNGGTATFTVTAAIAPGATGSITNTATVNAPATVVDTNLANNTASDTDTLVPVTGLAISKTDGSATYTPGAGATYTITVTNSGPSDATSVTLADTLPAGVTQSALATCVAGPGASCGAITNLGAGFSVAGAYVPASGSSLVYTVPVSFAAGMVAPSITNSVTVTNAASSGAGSTATGTDTDTLALVSDVAITKTDGSATYTPGNPITYTIIASNAGPSPVVGAAVADTVPAAITSPTWTCVASAGSSCPASGSGNIGAPVNLLVGGTAAFTLTGTVSPGATGNLVNTSTVAVPGGVTDPNPGNNSATDTDTANPIADVAVTKTDGQASVSAGGTTTYTVTVTNNGPSAVTGASVSDPLPAGVASFAWTCAATAGSSCPASGAGAINTNAVNLLASGVATFTVTANISGSATGTIVNTVTATVPAGTTDPTPGNNTATDTDTVSLVADLAITKTDGQATYTAGNAITYTIVASNNGPSAVTGAPVTDVVPAAITGAAWTCVASPGSVCGAASGAGNINTTADLLNGGTATFTLNGTVSASAVGNLVNTATIAVPAGVTDPTPGNDSATDTDTPNPVADLAITKTDGSATYTPGNPITYTIVASNNGPSAATGATVTDTVPAAIISPAWTCVASAGSTCPASGSGSIAALVNLLASGTATFTLTGTVSASATGNLVNTATVTAPPGTTDPAPGNNSATDTDTANPIADLAITKTDGSATYTAGNPITYTIVASNAGPSAVTGATVADTVPATITAPAWTCVASAGSSCPASGSGDIGASVNLLVGGTATFTLTGTVSASATGNLVNTATVTVPAGTTDPTPGNNSATDTNTANPVADLAITKTDGTSSATPGNPITYTMVASNTGPSAVTGATVADTLPAMITGANWTCVASAGSNCPGSGSGNINALVNLLVGGTATFTLTGTVASTATGVLANTATIAPPGGTSDPNPGNNSATDVDTLVPQVALTLAKTDGMPSYTPGGTATYTITIGNGGPSAANDVTLTDPLPAGVTLSANVSCVASGTAGCGTVTGTTGQTSFGTTGASIAAGAGNNLVFTVPVAFASGMTTDPLDNTATATDLAASGSGSTATGTDSDTRGAVVALAVLKDDGATTYTPQGTATYVITVQNTGLSDAVNLTVSDVLPPGVTLSANATCAANGSSTCGTVTGAAGQATLGTTGAYLVPGGNNTIVFLAPVSFAAGMSANPLVNTATATDLTTGATASGQDSDALSPTVTLAATKDDGSATYTPGGTGTYTIIIRDTGVTDALDVTVSDPFPTGVTLSANATCVAHGTSSCGTVTGAPGQTSFGTTGARIDAGAANALEFTVPVAFAPGMTANPMVNVVAATDLASGNSTTATHSDTLSDDVTLAVSKDDGTASYTPGGTLTYTVIVADTGLSDALNVTITDLFPAGMTLSANATCVANGTSSCGAVTGTTGQASFGTTGARINAGAGNSLVFTVPVALSPAMTADPMINIATATDLASGTTSNAAHSDALVADVVLGVTKSDGSATYTPGGSATYTVTVANSGLSDALNVTVSDPLPPGITLSGNVMCTANGTSSCGTVSGTTGQAAFGTLAARVNAGAANTLVFSVPVAFSAGMSANPLVNTASAADTGSGDTASGSDSDALSANVSLVVAKTDGSATYTPGTGGTYTVTVTNTGISDAVNVTVTDALPAGVTLSANATCAASGTSTCGAVTGTTGQTAFGTTNARINAGAGNALSFTIPVLFAPAMTTDPLVNTAIATDVASGATGSGTDSDTLAAAAGLGITKTDGSATYTPGGTATYTIVVTNAGPSAANSVSVADALPAGVTLAAAAVCVPTGVATCGAVVGAAGAGAFGTTGATIAAGAGNRLTFTVPVNFAAGMVANPLVNTVTASDPAAGAPVSASDSDVRQASADVGVVKAGPATVKPGAAITYTLLITNAGPSPADGATFMDNVPGVITGVAASCGSAAGGASCGTVNVSGNSVSGMMPVFPAGGSVVITITGTVTDATTFTNTATVSPPPGTLDPNPSNSSSSATTSGTVAANPIPVDARWSLAVLAMLLAFAGARRATGAWARGRRR